MPNIFMPIFIVILSTVIGAIGAIALKKASSSLSFGASAPEDLRCHRDEHDHCDTRASTS